MLHLPLAGKGKGWARTNLLLLVLPEEEEGGQGCGW